jgi:hypothetical protein
MEHLECRKKIVSEIRAITEFPLIRKEDCETVLVIAKIIENNGGL